MAGRRVVLAEIADSELRRDGDVILAAPALTLSVPNVVMATENPAHLTRFVSAELWQNITP